MGTNVNLNGNNYVVPALGEGGWGADATSLTNYLIALGSGVLQKAGGSFTLTADIDFGAAKGIKAVKFSSRNTPATAGVVRLGNNESVAWRDVGNTADKALKLNTSDILEFDGNPLVTLALGTADTVLKMNTGATAYEFAKLADANIAAGAAIDATKIAGGGVSSTVFDYLVGVSSAIQTQLDAKIDDVATANDNEIPRFNTNGQALQNSGVTIDDSDNMAGVGDITMTGSLDMSTATNLRIGTTNATTILMGRFGETTVINGNLLVLGVTTTVDSQTLDVVDANITINKGGNQATANTIAGLTVEMSDATNVILLYDSSISSRWKIGDVGSEQEVLTTGHAQTITALKTINTELLVKQIATPSNPASGYNKIYPKTDDKLYYLNSAGLEQEIGSGSGSGSINFITNGDFEDGTVTGWSTYDDGAVSEPVDGTGGISSNITISSETTNVLNGTASLKIAKGAADAQGEGGSFDFTIPKGYRNIKNAISFIYATDGSYAAGDCAIFLYDKDTTTLITPRVSEITGYDKDNPGAVKYRHDFDIYDTTSVNYRLIAHVTSTNASAWDLYIDDLGIGPEKLSQGPSISGDMAFVPAFNNFTIGNASSVRGVYRSVANYMEGIAQIVAGSTSAITGLLSLDVPSGLSIDTDVMSTSSGYKRVGDVTILDSGFANYEGLANWRSADGNILQIRFLNDQSTEEKGTSVDATNPMTLAAGDEIFVSFKIPIAEWSGKAVTNLGANDVEYASNNGTWDSSSTSADTTFGAEGVEISGALTAYRSKNIAWQTPIQSTDVFELQFRGGTSGAWTTYSGSVHPYSIQNGVTYGAVVSRDASNPTTEALVEFGQYRRATGATFGAAGSAWASGTYWRVVKHRTGIPVSFGNATVDRAGLIKKNKWQEKFYNGTASSATTMVQFNGLVAGKVYQLIYQITGTTSGLAGGVVKENGVQVAEVTTEVSSSRGGGSVLFVATGSTATLEWSSGTIVGNNTAAQTWMQIIERNDLGTESTDFT